MRKLGGFRWKKNVFKKCLFDFYQENNLKWLLTTKNRNIKNYKNFYPQYLKIKQFLNKNSINI